MHQWAIGGIAAVKCLDLVVYIYIYIYIYICVCVYMYIFIDIYIYIYEYICTNSNAHQWAISSVAAVDCVHLVVCCCQTHKGSLNRIYI